MMIVSYGTKLGNVFGDPKGELIYNFWKDDKTLRAFYGEQP